MYGSGLVQTQLWLYALACGTGTEVVLRSKVYVKQTQTGGGNIEELLRGPFDLLRWYQNFFLELSAGSLAKSSRLTLPGLPGLRGACRAEASSLEYATFQALSVRVRPQARRAPPPRLIGVGTDQ